MKKVVAALSVCLFVGSFMLASGITNKAYAEDETYEGSADAGWEASDESVPVVEEDSSGTHDTEVNEAPAPEADWD